MIRGAIWVGALEGSSPTNIGRKMTFLGMIYILEYSKQNN